MMIEAKTTSGNTIVLNNSARWGLFIILLCVGIFSSADGGIIPQATTQLLHDFFNKTNNTNTTNQTFIDILSNDSKEIDIETQNNKIGLYGSIDYLGRVFGAIILTFTINKISRNIILIISLIFKALTLYYSLYDHENYMPNLIFRALSGLSQVFYTTYLPVWTDQFTPKDLRSILVSVTQLGNPVGIIIGFGISTILGEKKWYISFAIEASILLLLGLISICFPRIYFNKDFILNDDNITGVINEKDEESTLCKNLGIILCNPIFIFTTFSCSVAFFGMAVVQFWGKEYMEKVLKLNDPTGVAFRFSILCISGPTLGVFMGGIVCSKLGGYTNRNAIKMCFVFCLISSISSIFIGYAKDDKDEIFFFIFIWVYFFFIGAIIPATSGIIIASLPENLRGDGFSITNILLNLLGNFPASFAYSFLLDIFIKENKGDKSLGHQSAMKSIMYYNFIGLISIIVSMIFRLRQDDNNSGKNKIIVDNEED